VKVTYALSPQAKGKMERPYGWLQDRLIRTCVREDINDIKPAQQILRQESTDITTDRFTRPPKKFLIFVFKERCSRSTLSFENLKSSPLTNQQKISSVSGWIEP
jgi:hypothetical protein